jgi:ABC-type multidrug transport system fused ATPase/permease subunit
MRSDRLHGWERIKTLGSRQHWRQQRAESVFQASRNPERGMPVAENGVVIKFLKKLISTRKRLAVGLVAANGVAGIAGIVVPKMLGDLVDRVTVSGALDQAGILSHIGNMCLIVVAIVLAQAVLTWTARRVSTIFGRDMLAEAREYVMRSVLKLPLSRVESASTGDLITRVTRDVARMAGSIRWALPTFVISSVTTLLTVVAIIYNSWLLALPMLLAFIPLVLAVRRYLRYSMAGYITEGSSYSNVNSSLTETIEGIRSVESLGTQRRHIHLVDDDLEMAAQAEKYTMGLRAELTVVTTLVFQVPFALLILIAMWAFPHDWVTLGQITAATVYLQQLSSPINRMINTINQMQTGMASTTRLLGIATVPADRTSTDEVPVDSDLNAHDLYFAYRPGLDVLHGVSLDLHPGERLAIVGPSGSGKSTLGRLLSGINGPRSGLVEVGGVDVMHLPLSRLRTEVALVTQEHHVFVGTIRDNIVLAREDSATDDQVWEALETVEAADWVLRFPDGLDTMIGSSNQFLTPAQAQQIALARLVIADPHTLVLDEATSLIDPTTARHVEGDMHKLLTGRTVVAIAHRLHTAHDADRIAVVIDGRIVELGSHDELLALNGEYAKLWEAWSS